MNIQMIEKEDWAKDDVDWLSENTQDVVQEETNFFCKVVKDQLARGWALLDARHYALGKLIGVRSWSGLGATR